MPHNPRLTYNVYVHDFRQAVCFICYCYHILVFLLLLLLQLQIMDFFSVKDFEIPGYSLPQVVVELHSHLWSCAVDFRLVSGDL